MYYCVLCLLDNVFLLAISNFRIRMKVSLLFSFSFRMYSNLRREECEGSNLTCFISFIMC